MADQRELPRFLTLTEVAKLLRCHRTNVWRFIRSGRLEGYRLGAPGSEWRIPVEAVWRFVEQDRAGVGWLKRWKAVREAMDDRTEAA
jgi:excisionase family DNA binding protein